MVLKEALRSFTYFSLFGYNVDAIMLNRAVVEEAESGFLQSLREIQTQYIEQTHASFDPVPIFRLPLMAGEIVGLQSLNIIANLAFSESDPTAILFNQSIQDVIKTEEGFVLKRHFPSFEVERFDLRKKGDELILTIGNVRRSIILPKTLALLEPSGAEFKQGELRIHFKTDN